MSNAAPVLDDDFVHRPVDLVHLAKQTLGDRSLEHEVLRLFLTQSDVYLDRVENASSKDERFTAAHTIKGSAHNIGAWNVADVATHLETADDNEVIADIAALRVALEEACCFITDLLEEN